VGASDAILSAEFVARKLEAQKKAGAATVCDGGLRLSYKLGVRLDARMD